MTIKLKVRECETDLQMHVLALKIEEGAMIQGMQAASRLENG